MLRCPLLLALLVPLAWADWNPKLAAGFLDARQKAWFDWKPALATGAPCLSCHTGLPYLLARPALRRTLGGAPTEYETGLLDSLKRMQKGKSPQASGTEAVLAALLLTRDDPAGDIARKALDRLWTLQLRDGPAAGAFEWFNLNEDPWEMPESRYFGATLAAVAVGAAPAEYRAQAEVRGRLQALAAYLRSARDGQPLHNRALLLWASAGLPDLLSRNEKRALTDELWARQRDDGAWSLDALGPWTSHPDAVPAPGPNAYATAVAVFALEQAGVKPADRKLKRALDWLGARQDPESGAWNAVSMNKRYEAGSMQAGFMSDAATGWAVAALAGAGR